MITLLIFVLVAFAACWVVSEKLDDDLKFVFQGIAGCLIPVLVVLGIVFGF